MALVGIAGLLLTVIITLLAIGSDTRSRVLLTSDFNAGQGPFPVRSDRHVSLEYADDGYVTVIHAGSDQQVIRARLPRTVHFVRAEISATVRSCSGNCTIGIGPWENSAGQYTADAPREYTISTSGSGGQILLTSYTTLGFGRIVAWSEKLPASHRFHFVIEVRAGPANGWSTVSGSVNRVTVKGDDDQRVKSFNAIGLYVYGTANVLWDNLTVTEIPG